MNRISSPTISPSAGAMPGFSAPGAAIERRSKRAAMPRFRTANEPTTLTEAVRRILIRAHSNAQPFGAFMISGQLLFSNTKATRFEGLQQHWPDALVGAYTKEVNVANLIDDLNGYFPEESVNVAA